MTLIKRPRALRFIEEVASPTCVSPTDAARRAGYAHSSAPVVAAQLMADPEVRAAIQAKRDAAAQLTNLSVSMVLQRWLDVATADPSKIVRVRRLNCRYCWGKGHAYQWTEWEFAELAAQVMDWVPTKAQPKAPVLPDAAGGFGFVSNADPNPDCPRCHGEGHTDVFLADMSTLTGPERALLQSVEVTKEGVKVKLQSQQWAWDNLRDYLGMIVQREPGRQPGAPGELPAADVIDVLPSDPEQLTLLYTALTKGAT